MPFNVHLHKNTFPIFTLKAEEEMNTAKSVYDGINTELKQELPSLFERFVRVFSSVIICKYKGMHVCYSTVCFSPP